MTFRLALVFAGAALFLGSGIGIATAANDKPNAMQQRVIRAGNILGAATGCKDISRPRIKSVTGKVTEIIRVSAPPKKNRHHITNLRARSAAMVLGGGQSDYGVPTRSAVWKLRPRPSPLLRVPGHHSDDPHVTRSTPL
jgi:hypothetical protein